MRGSVGDRRDRAAIEAFIQADDCGSIIEWNPQAEAIFGWSRQEALGRHLIGMLLPDVQQMRRYAPMLILQVRVAIAEGNFTAAAHHLETGFAYSRQVAEGPTLIQRLVGVALALQFTDVVADFLERHEAFVISRTPTVINP